MSRTIPKRSMGGCLTCKRRKKKCDERRPYCSRCERGDFHCLGYDLHGTSGIGGSCYATNSELIRWPSHTTVTLGSESLSPESLDALIPFPGYENEVERSPVTHILFQEINNSLSSVPNAIKLDPVVLEDATSWIVSYYVKFSQEALFKLPSSSVESGLLWRISDSEITRWSMYLGARVAKDVSSGNNGQKYLGWIFRFYQQILETSPTQLNSGLESRLGGLLDLVHLVCMISGTTTGYALFKRCAPVFLQLAALTPTLWSNNFTISILEAIQSPRYEVMQFVIGDTIIALSLGTPPLFHYNTTPSWIDEAPSHFQLMYGFPIGVLLLLAKINAWRTLRLAGQVEESQGNWDDWEQHLNNWNPTIDHTDGPNNNIARFTVQEAWRQSAIIYLHMGMREVNSADPRVETAVQQIVQLAGIFKMGSRLESHLLIPYFIAGVAARQEKHRAALRGKLSSGLIRRVNAFLLSGSDFVATLDHLWHGAGSEGRPITWEDYVQSRCIILPVV
ncbi:unnamed protein product [Rhizoctonia solani]|uniref:Zn(2)-C6 fungal-type domain-containing protein n=1 Tax=Rhizoctonia solani TaxID=456999 RepID=A0A8H3HF76_9AGAM|nr:unnamed protein product [Rhizoctonia solani]